MTTLTLLSLPREVRDMIYSYALTSPTAHLVVSSPPKTRPKTKRPPRPSHPSSSYSYSSSGSSSRGRGRGIQLQPCLPPHHRPIPSLLPMSTALERTSRQLRCETLDWLWTHNTIVFSTPDMAAKALKCMGQRASRRLQHVLLHVAVFQPGENEQHLEEQNTKALVKALSMLASRSRHGALRDVGLVLDVRRLESSVADMVRRNGIEILSTFYMTRILGPGAKVLGWRRGDEMVRRTVYLRYDTEDDEWERLYRADEDQERVVMEAEAELCHKLWGGRLFCHEVLIWQDGVKVGEVADRQVKWRTQKPGRIR